MCYWACSWHMVLLQPFSCCPDCHCAMQCINVVRLCTRPFRCCRHATWRWKWHALAHKALLLSLLCNAMWNALVDIKLKLYACAPWLTHILCFGWESLCSSTCWHWLMRLRRGHWLLLNRHCIIVDCCLTNDDSQSKSSCACAWGAPCWHMLLSKLCLLMSPLRHTICK